MNLHDAASILGVSVNDDIQTLSTKYTELALKYHPNRNKEVSSQEKFQQINQAYICLVGKDEYNDMGRRKNSGEKRNHNNDGYGYSQKSAEISPTHPPCDLKKEEKRGEPKRQAKGNKRYQRLQVATKRF